MSLIWEDTQETGQAGQFDGALASRCLVLILIALAIFTGAMYCLYSHADASRPTWAQQIADGR